MARCSKTSLLEPRRQQHTHLRRDPPSSPLLLYGVLNTVQTEAQVRQVTVTADLPQDLPALLGDEGSLEACVHRLVSHAISRSLRRQRRGDLCHHSRRRRHDHSEGRWASHPGSAGRDLFSYVARKGVSRPCRRFHLGLAVARLLIELQRRARRATMLHQGETIVAVTIPSDA